VAGMLLTGCVSDVLHRNSAATTTPRTLAPLITATAQSSAPTVGDSAPGSPSFATCQGGTALPVPAGPHGVFALLPTPVPAALAGQIGTDVLPDPTNCGVTIVVRWADVDKGPTAPTRYDWTSVDALAAPWLAAHKVVNLAFEGVGANSNGSASTPGYVQASVTRVDCAAPNTPAHNPVYWDIAYQDAYRAFEFAAVVYANSLDGLGYLRFGIGAGTDSHPGHGYENAKCGAAWRAAGLSPPQWQSYAIAQLDFQASLNSKHPLVASLNELDPGDSTVPDAVAAEAVKLKFVVGSQVFSRADLANAQKSKPCSGNWCTSFGRSAGQVALQLQLATPTDPNGAAPSADLGSLALFGLSQQAQIFELRVDEWVLANDSTAPGYAKFHAGQHEVLARLSEAVG
jgi:hypothetical protein